MGYTHYWTHRRRFTNAEWSEDVLPDLLKIMATAIAEGITLGTAGGESPLPSPSAAVMGKELMFNGVGEEHHETFVVGQNRPELQPWQSPSQRGWDFCKTARKEYDTVVAACLCYLETCWDNRFTVSSDGDRDDWVAGLELARRALPTKTNMLELPLDVRWDSQFVLDMELYWFKSDVYYCRRTRDGAVLIGKYSDPYRPIGHIPSSKAEDFITAGKQRYQNVPRSAFGRDEVKRMRRKENAAMRDLLTYPELIDGAPETLLQFT